MFLVCYGGGLTAGQATVLLVATSEIRVRLRFKMRGGEAGPAVYRFGGFELETGPGELRKHGTRIKLQDQPLEILVLLLEHAGEVTTREQIQNRLWPPGTYVDYDNAINSAVRKLREALGDTSENPRYIETMARRGYRFIGHLDAPSNPDQPPPVPPAQRESQKRRIVVAGVCGGVLVLAGVLAGWWLLKPRLETRSVTLVPVPLTAAPGWETYASLSPDGNQVAYSWREGRDSVAHIYVKLIGEGKPVRLTSGDKSDDSPTWSPNGRSIAFLRDLDPSGAIYNIPALGGRERQGTCVIYTIPALGGAERQITEGRFISRMAWSPDSRFLAVAERQPESESSSVSLIPVENGDRLVLTKPPNGKTRDMDPVFSPDGRLLLFTRTTLHYRGGLYLLDLAAGYRPSGNPTLLRQESSDIAGAAWTANGSEVVYALSENSFDHRLMRIRAQAGSEPERLTFTGERAFWPAIAPRGKRLLYMQVLDDIDIWQVHPGETPRSFISSTRWEDAPQYSPDGKRVAFGSDRSGLRQVWACDADGGNQVQLTRFDRGPSGTPRWSPDGRWIAFDHEEEEGWRIYVMASDGGQVRKLAQDEGGSTIPSWSGDGKWIYYTNNQTGRMEIWKRPAEGGGQAIQVTHNGGWVAFESRDGQSLYYEKYFAPGLWVLPVSGGDEKRVLESVARRNFVVMNDGIYYMPVSAADGSTTLRFRSFATTQDKEIALIKDVVNGLAVSPDRKTILFSTYARTGSNVMVVDNFQ